MSGSQYFSVLNRFGLPIEKFYGMKQEDYLYDLHWDARDDILFIELLVQQHSIGNFHCQKENVMAIEIAQEGVKNKFRKTFPFSYCRKRVKVLRKRYSVFSWIVSNDGVTHDVDKNRAYASPRLWTELVRKEEFALAYMEEGDPSWKDLEKLFNPSQSVLPLIDLLEEFIPPGIIIESDSTAEIMYTGLDMKEKMPICKVLFSSNSNPKILSINQLAQDVDVGHCVSSTASTKIVYPITSPTTGLINRPPTRRFKIPTPTCSTSTCGSISPHNN